MKIAYLTFESPADKSGVGKKIRMQADYWRTAGNEVRHFLLSRPAGRPQAENIEYLLADEVRGKPTLAAWRSNRQIRAALKNWAPDVLYMRQVLWWPGAVRACDVAPLVVEFNSIALHEYRRQSMVKYGLELVSRSFLPGRAQGIVSVTPEIDRSVKASRPLRIVIGNGYDIVDTLPRRPPCNARPQLLFVGSPDQAWHGLDKLRELASLMPDCDFNIVVPGFSSEGPGNFICHGALYGEALAALYQKTDAAFGTLALHRKKMQEATPLKTREYLGHGIPTIIGYDDPDLAGAAYCLCIGNFEGNARQSTTQIRRFLDEWRGRTIDRDDIIRRLDYRVKESMRLAFFERAIAYAV